MQYKQLEAYAKELGYSREELAKNVGMTYQSLGNVINGKRDFLLSEVRKIVVFLKLDYEQTRFYFNLFK